MTAYYNEIDPYAAQWLRNLIAAGHIAPGVVDERSIEDVFPSDLRDFNQCHFFAGIGVWSYALRAAGWPDDRPVWTGSCPCQPFSAAGKGDGFADERHLWPAFHHLIGERRPPVVFGEQVASKDADAWIDLVCSDLEALEYAFGAVPFPSASVGAPHIRDRLYWVGDSSSTGLAKRQRLAGIPRRTSRAHTRKAAERAGVHTTGGLAHNDGQRPGHAPQVFPGRESALGSSGRHGGLGDADSINAWRDSGNGAGTEAPSRGGGALDGDLRHGADLAGGACNASPTNGLWRDADWLLCRDGRWRPVEPGTFPLANGATSRVGRLRAYGNAINAEQARIFTENVMELAA